jgi:hypothetical protein
LPTTRVVFAYAQMLYRRFQNCMAKKIKMFAPIRPWVPPVRPVWSNIIKYNFDFTIGLVSSSRLIFICATTKSESG